MQAGEKARPFAWGDPFLNGYEQAASEPQRTMLRGA